MRVIALSRCGDEKRESFRHSVEALGGVLHQRGKRVSMDPIEVASTWHTVTHCVQWDEDEFTFQDIVCAVLGKWVVRREWLEHSCLRGVWCEETPYGTRLAPLRLDNTSALFITGKFYAREHRPEHWATCMKSVFKLAGGRADLTRPQDATHYLLSTRDDPGHYIGIPGTRRDAVGMTLREMTKWFRYGGAAEEYGFTVENQRFPKDNPPKQNIRITSSHVNIYEDALHKSLRSGVTKNPKDTAYTNDPVRIEHAVRRVPLSELPPVENVAIDDYIPHATPTTPRKVEQGTPMSLPSEVPPPAFLAPKEFERFDFVTLRIAGEAHPAVVMAVLGGGQFRVAFGAKPEVIVVSSEMLIIRQVESPEGTKVGGGGGGGGEAPVRPHEELSPEPRIPVSPSAGGQELPPHSNRLKRLSDFFPLLSSEER